ncbi:hypothetical protein EJ06DRAFT_528250 [Trichodelitschia bisporula]|uniref:Uncharacterized protein n=1 Tax=Trichodelitschia bisporula TaxID=703511 RepID=A0A6G1I220_9PEZI|nr:hypothetical protein EJ06DRAFT_528250 [Trichodelitschia bisporula]
MPSTNDDISSMNVPLRQQNVSTTAYIPTLLQAFLIAREKYRAALEAKTKASTFADEVTENPWEFADRYSATWADLKKAIREGAMIQEQTDPQNAVHLIFDVVDAASAWEQQEAHFDKEMQERGDRACKAMDVAKEKTEEYDAAHAEMVEIKRRLEAACQAAHSMLTEDGRNTALVDRAWLHMSLLSP